MVDSMFEIIVIVVSTLVSYVSAISFRNAFPSRKQRAVNEAERLLGSR